MRFSSMYAGLALAAVTCGGRAVESRTNAPQVEGVRLRATEPQVRAILGPPQREHATIGMRFWDYGRGITVIWRMPEQVVHGVIVANAGTEGVGGVRIGDTEQDLLKRWGTPARVRQGGKYLDFLGDHWILSAEVGEGRVVRLTLLDANEDSAAIH